MPSWVQVDGKLIPKEEYEALEPKGPAIHIFHEGWYEHIDADPIYIKSRKQLREETRSRGLTSDYAE